MTKTPKATHEGTLPIGELDIPCAVLEDGTRVISERGIAKALGTKRGGSHWRRRKEGGDNLPVYVSAGNLEPFIDDDLRKQLLGLIPYKPSRGGAVANGLEATILPKICDVYLRARDAGAILPSQTHIARSADTLMRAFAHVGIVALVDEATGYQEVRARDELNKILSAYISDDLMKWAKRFPDEFYRQIFRLHGWPYDPGSVKRPSVVGKMTNELVYEQLPPGVLEELRHKNPRDEKGRRKHRHFQFLTEDIGDPHLQKQIVAVTTLMRAAPNKNVFTRMFRRAFPRAGQQEELPLGMDDEGV